MVGDDPLQAGGFVPQGLQLLHLAGDGLCGFAAIDPAQDRYDLLRRTLLSFWHLGYFLGAQTLIRNGSVLVRQVTHPAVYLNLSSSAMGSPAGHYKEKARSFVRRTGL